MYPPISSHNPSVHPNNHVTNVANMTRSTAEKSCDEDLEGEELWPKEELGISVFNTEDGAHIVAFKRVFG
jgi:hypothetical protein